MVGVVEPVRRLAPFDSSEQASANTYLAFTAALGTVVWLVTAVAGRLHASGHDTGHAHIELLGVAGGVTLVWLVAWLVRWGIAASSVDRGVWLSSPELVWSAVTVLAFVATGAGFLIGDSSLAEALMWAPWAAAYTVGYLATGLLVQRGGVYLAAGLASGAVLVAGLTVGVPAVFVVLAVLTAAPMLVDAARGGRELTTEGIPALRGSDADAGGAGGVVPE
jgi:hypothetical protein